MWPCATSIDPPDGSTEIGVTSCELLRTRTALELACMNPSLRSRQVIDALVLAPPRTARFVDARTGTSR
ncbi:unnamed protein product [Effrenium voratum]|nr:unnamed protein product [Effrenium voratum]